ncbi:tetratricopeptide repeat protein [Agrobacterium rosae]|uniref:Tetratricopeptide repeat protein n=1 Tax=Agrobacterium rosae TaxID=1972867 RepID=A0ABU4VVU8_9HYPH|nr:tetratricopeptide repeat protein [Agrobacterium rosae]MDX8329618.1 tetratricopeptide repeat protein [Agrobacterium rosae]
MLDKLREFANPFDFANPVSEERSFYGRSGELADVLYYLGHAKQTNRPIHLALVGARASGKTSFLNVAELEAKRRDFCTVRVNLNEGDVKSDLQFFFKVFNSVVMAAFASGGFGGNRSKSYFSYLELISSGAVDDNEHIPFISSIIMAKAISRDNYSANVPDNIIADDLVNISNEIKKPIIILFDECNVLKENRIILEKLRNIFMNMSGYMLMFAATDDFFPIMDDVFSPIMRQFKRIDIGPFKGHEDVSMCIRSPLGRLSLSERDIRMLTPRSFIDDVTTLSGRKPYEIQLICHYLFRQCQEGRSRRFSLTLETLEGIQAVLASGQNVDDRPLIRSAKKLKAGLMQTLEIVCGRTEYFSAEDCWRLEFLFNENFKLSKEQFLIYCDQLEQLGFIEREQDGTRFKGDQFEKIYIKYLARSKGNTLTFSSLDQTEFVTSRFRTFSDEFEQLFPIGGQISESYDDLKPTLEALEGNVSDETKIIRPLVESLILSSVFHGAKGQAKVIELGYDSDFGRGQIWFLWQEPSHRAGLKRLNKKLQDLMARGNVIDVSITSTQFDWNVPDTTEAVVVLERLADEHLSTRVANEFMSMVHTFYVVKENKAMALTLASAAFRLQQSRLHAESNNVGYLYLDAGNYEEAELWLQAASQYGDDDGLQLLHYNKAILYAMTGKYPAAIFELERAKGEKDMSAACAFVISVGESGTLIKTEVQSVPSITVLIAGAISVLRAVQ